MVDAFYNSLSRTQVTKVFPFNSISYEDFFDFLRTMQACKETFGDTEMSMVIAPGQVCEKFFGEIEINN